ncbi:MAG: hypothetical protein PF569_04760 [Candidatus Woesearchaeota archaeon]|nr:hypothetical protein [Candidatus Woesearchaeota archaeon]
MKTTCFLITIMTIMQTIILVLIYIILTASNNVFYDQQTQININIEKIANQLECDLEDKCGIFPN